MLSKNLTNCQLIPPNLRDWSQRLLEKIYRSQGPVMRRMMVAVGTVQLVGTRAGTGRLASERASMDGRLHNVVRSDVVVTRQRQTSRLHRDPATQPIFPSFAPKFTSKVVSHLEGSLGFE